MKFYIRYFIAILALCCTQVVYALPSRVDLLCKPRAGSPPYTRDVQFRIDKDADSWCSDKCLSTNRIFDDDGTNLTFIKEATDAGAFFAKNITYSRTTLTLVNETNYSFRAKQVIEYDCTEKQFSGFIPDKSEDPRFLGPWPDREDYPKEAKRNKIDGRTTVQLQIDATGKLNSCNVSASSGSSDLDRHSCQFLMKRGRFLAAKDEKGTPIAGVLSKTFVWHIAGPQR